MTSRLRKSKRDEYRSRDVWSITLGFPHRFYTPALSKLTGGVREYKKFLIDSGSGEPVAMKVREIEEC